MVFDGSGSFILPNSCAGVAPVRKAITGVQGRIPPDVPGVRLEAPNVSARGADDVVLGGEVAQRGVSDAESIEGDEVREPDVGTAHQIQRPGKLRTIC